MGKCQIFISYRRDGGGALAGRFSDRLKDLGYEVFYDVDSMQSGTFNTQILEAIAQCSDVLLILSPNALDRCVNDDDWVRQEVSLALRCGKNIIPVLMNGFSFPSTLPADIEKVKIMEGVLVYNEYFSAALDRIEELLTCKKTMPTTSNEVQAAPVASGPNATALVTRGYNAIEDGDFAEAKTHFDKALDIDAECARAYLGLALAINNLKTIKDLVMGDNLNDKNYQRAKKYADKALLDELEGYEKKLQAKKELEAKKLQEKQERLEKERKEREEREARERKEREEREEKERQARIIALREKREKIQSVQNLISSGGDSYEGHHTVGLKSDGTVVAVGYNFWDQCEVSDWTDIVAISAGGYHTAGLKSDGTVVAVGGRIWDQREVSDWTDIVAISTGKNHTVGLKSDGTVVAVGNNADGQCEVSDWTDIVAIATENDHTVGLKSDGTVVAVGYNLDGQCKVSDWTNIVAISTGCRHTVGLKSDGTVVAVGYNKYGQCNVYDWTDIVAISTGVEHTVGLKSDGTVVAVGDNYSGQCDVSYWGWTDIVAIFAGASYTVGLKSDGTVVTVGNNYSLKCEERDWTDIVAIFAGDSYTVGLKSDGTVVAAGNNRQGQCNVGGWKLFGDFNNIEEERRLAKENRIAEEKRIAEERRIAEEAERKQKAAYRAQGVCQYCGGIFKGLFTKRCASCGREKDY